MEKKQKKKRKTEKSNDLAEWAEVCIFLIR